MPLWQHKDGTLVIDQHNHRPCAITPGGPRGELVAGSLPVRSSLRQQSKRHADTLVRLIHAPPMHSVVLPDRTDHERAAPATGTCAQPERLACPDAGWVRRQTVATVADGSRWATRFASSAMSVKLLACRTHTLRRYGPRVDENPAAPTTLSRTPRC